MKKKGLVLFLLSALLFTACGTEKNKTGETDKLTVVTSFYPVYLLAQEIVQGAEGIRLENMAQPQTGCLHDYELSISDMKLLETADIFIINGTLLLITACVDFYCYDGQYDLLLHRSPG